MIWIIIVLVIVIVFLIFYGLWLQTNVRHITETLNFINKEDTVREVTVGTNSKPFVDLVNACNQLVKDNKELIDQVHKREVALQSSVSNIVHDLRTPLTVASGYTQMVCEEVDDVKQRETLTNVIQKINEVSSSLEMLYEFSRIEERQKYQFETINLSKVLKETIIAYFDAFEAAQISLEIDIEPNINVKGDETAIKSMLNNLVSNMLKYAKGQATIRFIRKKGSMQLCFENAMRHDSINTEKIFDRFETYDSDGTGLGLFMVEKIAQSHTWNIAAEAMNGLFSITISDIHEVD